MDARYNPLRFIELAYKLISQLYCLQCGVTSVF